MNPLSQDERRALGLLLALLLIAAAARWIERPRSLLDHVPDVDIAALEDASRDAKEERGAKKAPTGSSRSAATRRAPNSTPRAPRADEPSRAVESASAEKTFERIDPNRAGVDELTRLPGIGPSLAARIVAAREQAPFATLDDLRRVRGIGPALAAQIAEHVTLPPGSGQTTKTERGTKSPATTSPTTRAPAAVAPIDLNRATAAQLDAIPGIGPALAARLIARRDSLGRFRSYDDVDAVAGVGAALLERIRRATLLRP